MGSLFDKKSLKNVYASLLIEPTPGKKTKQ